MDKVFQYELWHECNSMCKFCLLSNERNVKEKDIKKIESITKCSKDIDKLDFTQFKTIGLIGGEFFQGQLSSPEVKKAFTDLLMKVFSLRVDNKINSIWVAATLTIGDQHDLYEILDKAKELGVTNLWVCTSWDSVGRFHTQKMLDNWEMHMNKLDSYAPNIKKNTTIILSEDFLNKFLKNEFNIVEFEKKFNTKLFFKPAILPRSYSEEVLGNAITKDVSLNNRKFLQEKFGINFYPKRSSMLRFLAKFKDEHPDLFIKLYNNAFRSSDMHFMSYSGETDAYLSNRTREKTTEKIDLHSLEQFLECGHPVFYSTYIDSDKCFICDKNAIGAESN